MAPPTVGTNTSVATTTDSRSTMPTPIDRDTLFQLPFYAGADVFMRSVGWKKRGTGNVMVNKSNGDDCTVVAVGQVLDDRLYCGPLGNFSDTGTYKKALQDAKFTLVLGRPNHKAFAADFDKAIQNLSAAQMRIAMTDSHRHMLEEVTANAMLRLTTPMWESRVCILSDVLSLRTDQVLGQHNYEQR